MRGIRLDLVVVGDLHVSELFSAFSAFKGVVRAARLTLIRFDAHGAVIPNLDRGEVLDVRDRKLDAEVLEAPRDDWRHLFGDARSRREDANVLPLRDPLPHTKGHARNRLANVIRPLPAAVLGKRAVEVYCDPTAHKFPFTGRLLGGFGAAASIAR